MSYGMRVWDASGVLRMDENSFTGRIVLSVVVTNDGWTITNSSAGVGYKDISVPGITASNGTVAFIPVANFTNTDTQFMAQVMTGVVRIYNYNIGYAGTPNRSTVSSMRLFVIRVS